MYLNHINNKPKILYEQKNTTGKGASRVRKLPSIGQFSVERAAASANEMADWKHASAGAGYCDQPVAGAGKQRLVFWLAPATQSNEHAGEHKHGQAVDYGFSKRSTDASQDKEACHEEAG